MKIRLIYPKFVKFLEDHPGLKESLKEHVVGNYTMPPSLALPILAALTPPDIEVCLTDDNIGQEIDYDEDVDLVAISCFTPQAERAYEIADNYKKRKTPVVIGGLHPTFRPQEAAEHVNSVCIGEGEALWHTILEDARKRSLQPSYKSEIRYNLENGPVPKRSIFKKDKYRWDAHHVMTSRGCPVRCIGCPLPEHEGHSFRYRPIQNIIEDIKQMEYQEFYFIEDTLMLPGKKNQKFILN
ncbi:MAG: cobalamin-dependent protein, partial [Chitinispirillia bacterium]